MNGINVGGFPCQDLIQNHLFSGLSTLAKNRTWI